MAERFTPGKVAPENVFDVFWGGGRKTYENFEGKCGPMLVFTGVGGWYPEGGMQEYMEDRDVRGACVYLGYSVWGLEKNFRKFEEWVDKYPDPIVVAQSAAGLGLFLWAERTGSWHKMKKIFTAGTAFGGIDWNSESARKGIIELLRGDFARWLPKIPLAGRTFRELSVGSEALQEIAEIDPPEGKVVSFFSRKGDWVTDSNFDGRWPTVMQDAGDHSWHAQNKWIANALDCELGIEALK